MKPIEERANAAWSDYEYREGELYSTCFMDGFSAGAQSERDELTRWRDPKVELPNYAVNTALPFTKQMGAGIIIGTRTMDL